MYPFRLGEEEGEEEGEELTFLGVNSENKEEIS
jgi:hypothetical protein